MKRVIRPTYRPGQSKMSLSENEQYKQHLRIGSQMETQTRQRGMKSSRETNMWITLMKSSLYNKTGNGQLFLFYYILL